MNSKDERPNNHVDEPLGGSSYSDVNVLFAELDAKIAQEKKDNPIGYYARIVWCYIRDKLSTLRWFIMRDIPHRIKWGCSDKDIWSLDYSLAKWMVPRLKAYISKIHGFPTEPAFMNLGDEAGLAKWKEIVGKMLFAFEYIIKANDECLDVEAWDNEQVIEGLDLFREYYFDLWD